MPVNGVSNSTGPVLGAPARDYGQTSKLDFINLLVAQIRNQDPLSPMDNAEFTSQITQFTMLEELQKLGGKLDDDLMVSQSLNNTAMLALVGRKVTVEGDKVWLTGEGASRTYVDAAGTGRATIEIVDANGKVVETYHRDLVAGRNDVTWDGYLDDEEQPAAEGEYTLRVSVEKDGVPVQHVTLMTGAVTGLRYENGIAVVEVGGDEFYVSEIYKVS
ncbi:MAG: flagellar hook capping FlgD N-terminal domain-containing protein [Candidatus Krumholzibacteriia bacterium]